MTEPVVPPDDTEPDDLTELTAAVRGLSRSVQDLATRTRRNRLWLTVTAVGLVLDLLLSGFFWRLYEQQSCLIHRSQALSGPAHTMFTELATVFDDLDSRDHKGPPVTQAQILSDFGSLRVATDHYVAVSNQHPPTCSLF